MAENGTTPVKNTYFKAKLVRERFILRPRKSKTDEESQIAVGNRLNIKCFDYTGNKETDFIIRAQNIHTCMRIGASVAEQCTITDI